jgi:prolipoprotein diacylglyceryltransferase
MLLRWRRRRVADIQHLGRYLVLSNAARFAIEFIRVKNERGALGLTLAQWISIALAAAGIVMLARPRAPVPSGG